MKFIKENTEKKYNCSWCYDRGWVSVGIPEYNKTFKTTIYKNKAGCTCDKCEIGLALAEKFPNKAKFSELVRRTNYTKVS